MKARHFKLRIGALGAVPLLLLPLALWGQGSTDGGVNSGGGKVAGPSFSITGGVGPLAGGVAAGPSYGITGGLAYLSLSEVSAAPAALSGTYVIGPNVEDNYATFAAAVAALNAEGVAGPVLFQVVEGTYTEQVTIGLIAGVSAANTITFEAHPANTGAVTLEYNSADVNTPVLLLSSAQWIIIRQLTIKALHATNSRVVSIDFDADNLLLVDNAFIGSTASLAADIMVVGGGPGLRADNLTVQRNTFLDGARGIWMTGSAGDEVTGTLIDGNTFSGQLSAAIQFHNVDAPVISANTIKNSNTAEAGYIAIDILGAINELLILGNRIDIAFGFRGISLNGVSGFPGEVLVANNVINLNSSGGGAALFATSSGYFNVYHNTIISTESADGTVHIRDGGYISVKNNYIVNNGGGHAVYTATIPTPYSSNNNMLYSNGANLVYWGVTAYADLAAYQAGTGLETNSITEMPRFVDAANGDYSLSSRSLAIGAGDAAVVSSPLDFDIAGTARPLPAGSNPDMGAFENLLGAPVPRLVTDATPTILGGIWGVLAGDLRDDGLARTVFSSNLEDSVHVYGYSAGSYVREWSGKILSDDGWLIPIAVGDLDNDFQTEFLVASQDSVYMYEWDSGSATYRQVFQQYLPWTNVPTVILDLDRDGLNEIVLALPGKMEVFRYNPSLNALESVASVNVTNWSTLQISAGDTDNDGETEVILVGKGNPGAIAVLGYDGANYVLEAEITGFADGLGGAAIADFDGDGTQEIVAGLFNVGAATYPIYRVDYDGTNYQVSTLLNDAGNGMFQVHAGDIDGDGLPEAHVLVNGGTALIVEYESGNYVVETGLGGGVYGAMADVDGDGLVEMISTGIASDAIGTANTVAPAAPAGLVATGRDGSVTLSWTASTEADLSHYLLYRSTASGFSISTTYLIGRLSRHNVASLNANLANDTPYYFRLTAVDQAGNEGPPSEEAGATPTLPEANTAAIYFTGVGSRAVIADEFPIDGAANPGGLIVTGKQLAVEAWVFPMVLAAGDTGVIFSRPDFFSGNLIGYELRLVADAIGNINVEFAVSDGASQVAVAREPITGGQWVHIAGVYSGSAVDIFVNGAVGTGAVTNGFALGAGADRWTLGNRYRSRRHAYNGLIDELRVWNVAKTSSDIISAMNTSLIGNETGLAGYWPFEKDSTDSNTGIPISLDLTANRNHIRRSLGAPSILAMPSPDNAGVSIAAEIFARDLVTYVGSTREYQALARGWPIPTVSLLSGPSVMSVTTGGIMTWTPTSSELGSHAFELSAANVSATVTGGYTIWVNGFPTQFATHNNGIVEMSTYNNGIIGRGLGWSGTGFRLSGGADALFEAQFALAASSSRASGRLYGGVGAHDYATTSPLDILADTPPPGFDQVYRASFNDSKAATPIGIEVTKISFSNATSPDNNYVLISFDLENTSGGTLTGIYTGLAMDWDVGDPFNNLGGFDTGLNLGYIYESPAASPPNPGADISVAPGKSATLAGVAADPNYYGVVLLEGTRSGYAVGPYYANTEANLYTYLTTDQTVPTAAGDMLVTLGAGPYNFAPGERHRVSFAIAGASSLAELQVTAQAAQAAFSRITTLTATAGLASAITNNSATLSGTVSAAGKDLTLFFEYGVGAAFDLAVSASPANIGGYGRIAAQADLAGLAANTTYQYRLVADDLASNRVIESAAQSFTTTAAAGDVTDNGVIAGDTTVTFPNTGVEMNFTFSGGAGNDTVEVMLFASTPDGALPANDTPVGGQYWEFNHYGSGTFSVDLTLNFPANTLSAADLADLTLLNLMKRASGGGGPWTGIRTAASASDRSVTFNALTGFSQYVVTLTTPADTEAPIASNFSLQSSGPQLGNDLTLTVTVTDNDAVSSVDLYAAGGGSSAYATIAMSSSGGSGYTATIPSAAISLTGMAAYVIAADASGNKDTTAAIYSGTRFAADELGTQSLGGNPYSSGFPKDKWRLISVPAILDNASLLGNFEELGAVDNTVWRLYGYRNDAFTENPTSLGAGESFWLYQRVAEALHFSVTSGITGGESQMAKSISPGWSLIGSPFAFSVTVAAPSAEFFGPFTYDGAQWTGKAASLLPWQGYAIYNRTTAPQTLIFSVPPFSKEILSKEAPLADSGWELRLSAQGQNYGDSNTLIGRHAAATEGLDRFDNPEPPYVENYVYLAMDRSDWQEGLPLLTSDIRSLDEANGEWELALYTRGETGAITISAELAGELSGDLQVRMVDLQNREIYDLTYGLGLLAIRDYNDKFPYRFKVLAGSAAYVDQAAAQVLAELPQVFGLSNNYPNPFNPNTRIPYTLTHPARVSLKIYNLLGQEVATLVSGWQDMGRYEAQWNGLNTTGQPVASGLYFAVYTAEGKTYTRKMILMR